MICQKGTIFFKPIHDQDIFSSRRLRMCMLDIFFLLIYFCFFRLTKCVDFLGAVVVCMNFVLVQVCSVQDIFTQSPILPLESQNQFCLSLFPVLPSDELSLSSNENKNKKRKVISLIF